IDLTASHTGIEINDTLPSELTPIGEVTVDGGTGSSTGSHPTLVSGLSLAAGERVTVSYQARVDNTPLLGGERLTNTAAIQSDQLPTDIQDASAVRIKPADGDSDGIADLFDSAPNDPTLPESYAPQIYITYSDNENNLGTGTPDDDMAPNSIRATSTNHPIEFNIWVDQALPSQNALLSILSEDVDWPNEFNEVYLNGHKLQEMVGDDDLFNSTVFIIPDISWVNLGNNLVQLEVNVNESSTWSTQVFNGQIIADFKDEPIGKASIRSLATTSATVGYDDTFTVTLEVDTTDPISQAVRLELVLRDANGTAVAFDESDAAREFVATSGDEPHQWIVTLPSSGGDGIWTLSTVIYDFENSTFSDYAALPIAVPNSLSATPIISGISPSEGFAEAAIVITGTNFMADNTTCTVGGVPLQNQFIPNGNTVTGTISDTLGIESHDVVCTTLYGSDTSADGFTLLNTPPIAVNDDAGAVSQNASILINVLTNDFDTNGDSLSVGTVGSTADGTTALSGTTHIVFTPTADFAGTTVFTYTAFDGNDYSNPATVFLTVTGSAPSARDDAVFIRRDDAGQLTNMGSMVSGQPVTISVLSNDSNAEARDSESSGLTILSASSGSRGGSVTVNQNGLWIEYTPSGSFTGSEQFTYTVENSVRLTDTATVTVTIVNGDGGITADPEDGDSTIIIPNAGISDTLTVTLTIPEESADETLTLIYNDQDEPSGPVLEDDLGLFYFTLDAYIDNSLQTSYMFSTPITLTLEYSDVDIENLPLGENSLEVWRWDGTQWSRDGIISVILTPESNQITIEIDRPGEYAVIANLNFSYPLPLYLEEAVLE
ncbi:MAG: Ig-like domain-containing protein, partial [Chloroflexota bacterium]